MFVSKLVGLVFLVSVLFIMFFCLLWVWLSVPVQSIACSENTGAERGFQ